ncbi:MAG: hypothetical protein HUU50_04920 [Candidatus Brocadiae bacterium]|nr:hypothetical protein [Candidatus Brocadiia bacterium]
MLIFQTGLFIKQNSTDFFVRATKVFFALNNRNPSQKAMVSFLCLLEMETFFWQNKLIPGQELVISPLQKLLVLNLPDFVHHSYRRKPGLHK